MVLFLKKVLQFSIATLIVYLAFVFTLGRSGIMFKGLNFFPLGPSRLANRIEDLGAIKELDVLFMGSSHSFMSFDPRIFKSSGYSAFNLGSVAQTPVQAEYLYLNYVERLKIDLIIYEVCPDDISDPGVESNIDFLNSLKMDWSLFNMTWRLKTFRSINTMVFSVLNGFTGGNYSASQDNGYIRGTGFSPVYETKREDNKEYKLREVEVNQKQWKALFNLTENWRTNGQNFILIQAPVKTRFYSSIKNAKMTDSIFNDLGPYINFNIPENRLKLDLNDSIDFFNSHHLNQYGVEKFNQILLDQLFLKNPK